ncbi:MAG: hypothetical protein ACK4QL_02840 [Pseudanabaenaceae cyanobacterium]
MESGNTDDLAKWHRLEAELNEAEETLQELRRGLALGYRKDRLLSQSEGLKNLQEKLDELDIEIASYLFSWSTLKVPFWQIVRFTGLGILIGFGLRGCA